MPAEAKQSSLWKWYICGLLLLATTINYMDRQTLANAAVRVTKEFQLSQEQYGDMELAFGWAFALGSLVFGFLADRFRVYWLYPVVLAGWSLMGIASAHTEGYWPLLKCRVLLGFFEAGHWPCALKTTFALLDPKDRTMGNSVLQSGASIGAVVTPPLMLWLMTDDIKSWRFAFEVIGAIGLLWVVVWFVSIRKTELDVKTNISSITPPQSSEPDILTLICNQSYRLAVLFGCAEVASLIIGRSGVLLFKKSISFDEALAFSIEDLGGIPIVLAVWCVLKLGAQFFTRQRHQRLLLFFVGLMLCRLRGNFPWVGEGNLLLGCIFLIVAFAPDLFEILVNSKFWALAIVIFGAQTCWQLFRVWLPKFLQEGRGYSETEALAFNSAYYIGTDVGCIAAGFISLWLARRFAISAHGARRWVYAGACVLTSFSVLLLWLPKGWALMGAILVVGAGALALFPCYYSFVQELSERHVGRLTGLLSMWVWAVSSPMHKLFGRLVDETKSFDLGMAMSGLAPWLGVIAMKLLWDTQKTDSSTVATR